MPAMEYTAGGPIIEHQWYPCELKDCPECVLLTQFSHAAVPPENVAAGAALRAAVRFPAVTADLVRPLCCCLPLCRIFQLAILFVRCARAFSHAVQVAVRFPVAAADPVLALCCRLPFYCIFLTSVSLRLLLCMQRGKTASFSFSKADSPALACTKCGQAQDAQPPGTVRPACMGRSEPSWFLVPLLSFHGVVHHCPDCLQGDLDKNLVIVEETGLLLSDAPLRPAPAAPRSNFGPPVRSSGELPLRRPPPRSAGDRGRLPRMPRVEKLIQKGGVTIRLRTVHGGRGCPHGPPLLEGEPSGSPPATHGSSPGGGESSGSLPAALHSP